MNWKLIVFATALTAVSAEGAIIADWKQDELTGPLIDSSGNHPLGIPTGGPTYGAQGVPKSAPHSVLGVGASFAKLAMCGVPGAGARLGPTVARVKPR